MADSLSWASIPSKRIPDPPEAAVAEVLFVDRGKVGDALLDEEERGPPIVGTATGEVGFAEFRPEDVVKVPAVGRKADNSLTGVLTKGLADIGGGGGREGLGKHGGVSRQHVEFKQDEFRDRDVLAILKGFQKRCLRVVGITGLDGGQKDVGIQ